MNFFRKPNLLALGAVLAFLAMSCVKQPETIVINQDPESPDTPRSAGETAASDSAESADFRQLTIGEIHNIPTLDPLFADNNSTRRALQILYEGLVRFNGNGAVVPAISRRWSVSDDSLTYRFTLRNNVYYHDSEIFTSGVGRKVVASDFKFAMERMARINVPGDAAQLFMSIRGFEPFFQEQHNVLNPAYRQLNGVSGIETPNDSTLVLTLVEKDRNLLQKLASPYALVYPREAVAAAPADFAPVGSGPFQLSQRQGNSTFVFAKYREYWNANNGQPIIDRVDVRVERNETQLFRAMAERNVHLIPDMGPRIMESLMMNNAQLQPAYREGYRLLLPGGSSTYSLELTDSPPQPADAVRTLFASLDLQGLLSGLPSAMIVDTYQVSAPEGAPDTASVSISMPIYSTYTEDPFQQLMLTRISSQLNRGRSLQMLRIRTPSRQTAIDTRSFIPLYEGDTTGRDSATLLQYSARQAALAIRQINGLEFNRYPWWINLRRADLPGVDQL